MSEAARALIGCCLTRGQIFKTERVKAFEHSRPASMKFDPDTGKPLWADVSFCILLPRDPDYTDGVDLSCVEPKKDLGGLFLFHDRSGWGESEARYLLGGLAVEDGTYRHTNFKPIEGVAAIHDAVRKILEPHRLWNPSRFGLWVVHYHAI